MSPWRVLKWIIGILILFIVFFIGVKAGEFHVEFRNMMYGSYHHQMMMGQGAMPMMPAATGTTTTAQ